MTHPDKYRPVPSTVRCLVPGWAGALLLMTAVSGTVSGQVAPEGELKPMTPDAARMMLVSAISSSRDEAGVAFDTVLTAGGGVLDAVAAGWASVDERVARIVGPSLPDPWRFGQAKKIDDRGIGSPPAWTRDDGITPFLRLNLVTFVGRELSRRRQLDEAAEWFSFVPPTDASFLVDPATHYFHEAVVRHGLQQGPATLAAIDRLLSVRPVPERYRGTAELLRLTVQTLEKEKLSGIAHDMRDLARRLELGHTDQRLQAIEKDVVSRLDKIITEIEKKSSSASSGGIPSGSPALNSNRTPGDSSGVADSKKKPGGNPWGNLPEKQRDAALQDIGRDFPAHYRDAIEEYFRVLATEKGR